MKSLWQAPDGMQIRQHHSNPATNMRPKLTKQDQFQPLKYGTKAVIWLTNCFYRFTYCNLRCVLPYWNLNLILIAEICLPYNSTWQSINKINSMPPKPCCLLWKLYVLDSVTYRILVRFTNTSALVLRSQISILTSNMEYGRTCECIQMSSNSFT